MNGVPANCMGYVTTAPAEHEAACRSDLTSNGTISQHGRRSPRSLRQIGGVCRGAAAAYSFVQRVMAVSRAPSTAVLGREEPGIAAGPAMASPANRTNTRQLQRTWTKADW